MRGLWVAWVGKCDLKFEILDFKLGARNAGGIWAVREVPHLKQIIGMICFIVTVAAVVGNGTLMLISPRIWFRVPQWVRLSGSLSETKYSSGWGAAQIRALGACLLAIMVWFLHGCVSGKLTR